MMVLCESFCDGGTWLYGLLCYVYRHLVLALLLMTKSEENWDIESFR